MDSSRRWTTVLSSLGRPEVLLAIVLALGLAFAVFATDHYGRSWDEEGDLSYGRTVLHAYLGETRSLGVGDRRYYGPFFWGLSSAVSQIVDRIRPGWPPSDVQHVVNFLAFQVGVVSLFWIARRAVDSRSALFASLLFATQPVLFGHAFINQKDIPFLGAFTLAVALGLAIGEGPEHSPRPPLGPNPEEGPSVWVRVRERWMRSGLSTQATWAGVTAAGTITAAIVWLEIGPLEWAHAAVRVAYEGQAWPPLQDAFSIIAQDAYKTPLTAYLQKVSSIYDWLKVPASLLVMVPSLGLLRGILEQDLSREIARKWIRSIGLASVTLGTAMSVRVAGLFAGVLVTGYHLARGRSRSIPALAGYWTAAFLVCYITWPYLWSDPITRLAESVRVMGDFPSHFTLFWGEPNSSRNLPWEFLPTTLAIQLTEPALSLAVGGIGLAIRELFVGRQRRPLWAIVLFWVGVPILATVVLRVPLYNNFRQLLFITPALFLLVALAWSRLRALLGSRKLMAALGGWMLLPGLVGIVSLHPYEYVYYNQGVGGVGGVVGQFQHDYWCTSYRAAMEFVNSVASSGAVIAVREPVASARIYARPDLVIRNFASDDATPVYILSCNNRGLLTPSMVEGLAVEQTISRDDAILSLVLRGPAWE